jgi:acyl homoserine lactone synthase
MITILSKVDKPTNRELFVQMFRGRAAVFNDRLGWNVVVRNGLEADRCDYKANPTYIVATDEASTVLGSLRVLPMTGPTMLRNEFSAMFPPLPDVDKATIWECTRFCVHSLPSGVLRRTAGLKISSELLIGLCELAMSKGIAQIIGVYEEHMMRVYRRIGWSPTPLARAKPGVGRLIVGVWTVSPSAVQDMMARMDQPERGFEQAA